MGYRYTFTTNHSLIELSKEFCEIHGDLLNFSEMETGKFTPPISTKYEIKLTQSILEDIENEVLKNIGSGELINPLILVMMGECGDIQKFIFDENGMAQITDTYEILNQL